MEEAKTRSQGSQILCQHTVLRPSAPLGALRKKTGILNPRLNKFCTQIKMATSSSPCGQVLSVPPAQVPTEVPAILPFNPMHSWGRQRIGKTQKKSRQSAVCCTANGRKGLGIALQEIESFLLDGKEVSGTLGLTLGPPHICPRPLLPSPQGFGQSESSSSFQL